MHIASQLLRWMEVNYRSCKVHLRRLIRKLSNYSISDVFVPLALSLLVSLLLPCFLAVRLARIVAQVLVECLKDDLLGIAL